MHVHVRKPGQRRSTLAVDALRSGGNRNVGGTAGRNDASVLNDDPAIFDRSAAIAVDDSYVGYRDRGGGGRGRCERSRDRGEQAEQRAPACLPGEAGRRNHGFFLHELIRALHGLAPHDLGTLAM